MRHILILASPMLAVAAIFITLAVCFHSSHCGNERSAQCYSEHHAVVTYSDGHTEIIGR